MKAASLELVGVRKLKLTTDVVWFLAQAVSGERAPINRGGYGANAPHRCNINVELMVARFDKLPRSE